MTVVSAAAREEVQVRVEPGAAVIAAPRGALLLDVLRQSNVPISYSCQAGRCGTCRCELLSGEVLEDPEREFRSPIGDEAHRVLACRTRLVSDCAIGLVEPDEVVLHPAQVLRCRVVDVHTLSDSVVGLRLRPNRPLTFSAGQFVKLDFGGGRVRPYSMASAEGDDLLYFHLRRISGGRVTSFVAEQVRAGHTVKLTGPLGTSYLRRRHAGPSLCVAGGTGLAPVSSIVRTALHNGLPGPFHLYVGAGRASDLYGIEALRALARRYPSRLELNVASDTAPRDAAVRQGLITDVVAEDLSSLAGWKIYLAGPPPMVEAGIRLARSRGARSADIHADAFYPSCSERME